MFRVLALAVRASNPVLGLCMLGPRTKGVSLDAITGTIITIITIIITTTITMEHIASVKNPR